jgi:hypothetical protein
MHLKTDDLIDLAEGTRPEASAPHLAECQQCRVQLDELRAMMSAAQDVDVPEPSPLFWDHLSARLREALSEEAVPRPQRPWFRVALWRRIALDPMAVVSVAVLLVFVVMRSFVTGPAPVAAPPAVSVADAGNELLGDVTSDDDASLTLVASLTDEADLDTVREAGLATGGSAEHAVTHLSDGELRELGRLLKEELARSGA